MLEHNRNTPTFDIQAYILVSSKKRNCNLLEREREIERERKREKERERKKERGGGGEILGERGAPYSWMTFLSHGPGMTNLISRHL